MREFKIKVSTNRERQKLYWLSQSTNNTEKTPEIIHKRSNCNSLPGLL